MSLSSVDQNRASRSGGSASGAEGLGDSLCVFWLGAKCYALDVGFVGEVVSVEEWIEVPLTDPAVLGMCNLRGTALTLIELGSVLGVEVPASKGGEVMSVLVLCWEGMRVGARISRMDAVVPLDPRQYRALDAAEEHPAVQGLLSLPQGVATVLSGEEVSARVEALRFNG